MTIYDAAMRYQEDGTPLLVLAGKEYGSGSSRDWAAKGPLLLGVRAIIAESYERIHRSNLVGMGILPLQFQPGENAATLGLTGRETFDIPASPMAVPAPGDHRPRRARRRRDVGSPPSPGSTPSRHPLLPQRRHPPGRAAPVNEVSLVLGVGSTRQGALE